MIRIPEKILMTIKMPKKISMYYFIDNIKIDNNCIWIKFVGKTNNEK